MPYAAFLLLVGHALVHLAYVTPAPPHAEGAPEWPFAVGESWPVTHLGVSADVVRPVAYLLVTVVLVALVGAGLAIIGLVVPSAWWHALVVTGAGASLLLLTMCFHPWLVIGVAIDVVLLYLVLVNGWDPFAAGAAHRSMA
ncbi:MAG TPA: hypothetical protein VFQ46_05910 [Candidatus Limnocylindria bacterium]|nr:hypothetical protein [Candidatus Limnocylindria bacterium]